MNGNIHFFTYATHSQGMYEDLVNDFNKNHISLNVIGWGQKWISFMDKLKGVQEEIKQLPSTDVVIVIDAFDTRMSPGYSAEKILTIYQDIFGGAGLVFSKNIHTLYGFPDFLSSYMVKRIFKGDINSGMYIGRVEDVIPVLKAATNIGDVCRGDDQLALNKVAEKFSLIIDYDCKLFRNYEYYERDKDFLHHEAIFCGYPGTLSWWRLSRVPGEYLPLIFTNLWPEVLSILILIAVIIFII